MRNSKSSNRKKKRTKAEVQKILEELAVYLSKHPKASNKDISTQFNLSYASVSHYRKQINSTKKRTKEETKELHEKYLKLHKENPKMTAKEMAVKLDVSYDLLRYMRKKLGFSEVKDKNKIEARNKKIKELIEKRPDASNKDIAVEVGVSRSTVDIVRNKLGLGRSKEDSCGILFMSIGQQVKDLVLAEGHKLTVEQLLERIGISRVTLYKWLKKLGIPTGQVKRSKKAAACFRKMWSDGWSDTEIASVMGCCHQRVQKWRVKEGLISNTIHCGKHKKSEGRLFTPSTLLDQIESPTGNPKTDQIWAFLALGAKKDWILKRFDPIEETEVDDIIANLINWRVPSVLASVIKKYHLIDPGTKTND